MNNSERYRGILTVGAGLASAQAAAVGPGQTQGLPLQCCGGKYLSASSPPGPGLCKWHSPCMAGLLAWILLCPIGAIADDRIARADRLYRESGFENYRQAIALYEAVIASDPEKFEALWKCARAHQWFGDLARHRQVPEWKEHCERHGRAGMDSAARAIELKPERVEGYYYYGCSAGTYSDGVGILTVVREGIGRKIQENLEKAYNIDKRIPP